MATSNVNVDWKTFLEWCSKITIGSLLLVITFLYNEHQSLKKEFYEFKMEAVNKQDFREFEARQDTRFKDMMTYQDTRFQDLAARLEFLVRATKISN